MRRLFILFLCFYCSNGYLVRVRRSGEDAPLARRLSERSEVRRKPPMILQAIGPIAFGHRTGDDAKIPVNGVGTFGAGDVKSSVLKFTPEGSENEVPNSGTFQLEGQPNLGYMERETTAGKASGSKTMMRLGGIGTMEMNQGKEQGTGLLDFSKNLFPFLQLPPLKNDGSPDFENTNVDPRLADVMYSKPASQVYSKAMSTPEEKVQMPETPFKDISESAPPPSYRGNPFDEIKKRANYPGRARVHAVKTLNEQDKVEDSDMLPKSVDEGFIPQRKKVIDEEETPAEVIREENEQLSTRQKVQQFTGRVPLSQLGLDEKQVYALCAKFSKVAAKHCYQTKVEEQYIGKCKGYNEDCSQFIAKARPLGAIANSFSSGVGLTYYDWGVNGIPYYAVNEEGGIGNGHHGKVDFGSWGGGYSDNLGVRDFWSQTGEYGANWYEGTYGYKSGWSIPIVQSMGVEGGGGTQVHVPIKEGELGRPLSITNGYHVGPYLGLADRVGVDWYNGGVSWNKGFAVPFVGVGVNSGTSIGFPSVGHIMNRMGMNGLDMLNAAAHSSTTFVAPEVAGGTSSGTGVQFIPGRTDNPTPSFL